MILVNTAEHKFLGQLLRPSILVLFLLWVMGYLGTIFNWGMTCQLGEIRCEYCYGNMCTFCSEYVCTGFPSFMIFLNVLYWITVGWIVVKGRQYYKIRHLELSEKRTDDKTFKVQRRTLLLPLFALFVLCMVGVAGIATNWGIGYRIRMISFISYYLSIFWIVFYVIAWIILGAFILRELQYYNTHLPELVEKRKQEKGLQRAEVLPIQQTASQGEEKTKGWSLARTIVVFLILETIGLVGSFNGWDCIDGYCFILGQFSIVILLISGIWTLYKWPEFKKLYFGFKEKQKREEARQQVEQQVFQEKERIRLAEIERQQAEMARQRREEEEELALQRKEAEMLRILQTTSQIERVVLELAPQFSKLQVGEIAEKCGISDEDLIIKVLQNMIARKQIDAMYFKSTRSVAFQQQTIEKPFALEVPEVAYQFMEVRRQYEYVGGKVRIKVKVMNTGKVGLLRVMCMLNIPDSFKLLRVEPSDYSMEGSAVKLHDLLPKEEKTVAYVLEPMICGKEQFSGTISGVDASGGPFATSITLLEVEVRCPLFASPEEANLPLLKKMVADLPVKSERVFYLPETLSPADAFELATSAISERDVRLVGTVAPEDRKEGDSFDLSAWFYGTTKIDRKRYVLAAAVSEKDRVIRLSTACDDEAGCTGFLAEAGAAVRRELVQRGALESEKDVIELICEKCGATLPRAPTRDHDVRCPDCQWTWRTQDFFR